MLLYTSLRKKRRDILKKAMFFLMSILTIIFLPSITANAKTYSFYKAEYIDGVYYNMYNPNTERLHYQRGMVFRERSTNEFAYCIEPFRLFVDDQEYYDTNVNYLSQVAKERIAMLAHFGYGYKNHTDIKWYAVTQLLIWKEANPEGDYFFTEYLNGPRISLYENEINEMYNLVDNYTKLPSFAKKTFNTVEDNNLVLTDTNNVINNYTTNDNSVTIKNNQVTISNNTSGQKEITFTRKDDFYNKPIIFYESSFSQNLVDTGDINEISFKITLNTQPTNVKITKLDKTTHSITPSGDAKLDGAKFAVYNSNMQKITEVTIKNNQAILKNLDYGTYYLKELKAGTGYNLNPELLKFTLSKDNPNLELSTENDVIKAKIKIHKLYGSTNFQPEANVAFNIYNSKNELVKSITTDELGNAEIELPYGTYTLIQISSANGYEKINPLTFTVSSNKTLTYNLKDYKIAVPDTNTSYSLLDILILFAKAILC